MTTTQTAAPLPRVDARDPIIVDGVLYNLDAQVAAWVNAALGSREIVEVPFVGLGVMRDQPSGPAPASVDLDVGIYFFSYEAESDIMAAVAARNDAMDDMEKLRPTVRQVLDYPFATLNVPRISIEMDMANERGIATALRLGFKLEGRKRRKIKGVGDSGMFGLLREDAEKMKWWWPKTAEELAV